MVIINGINILQFNMTVMLATFVMKVDIIRLIADIATRGHCSVDGVENMDISLSITTTRMRTTRISAMLRQGPQLGLKFRTVNLTNQEREMSYPAALLRQN